MGQDIPEEKQTVLGFYVTSAEVYEKWRAAPALGQAVFEYERRMSRSISACGKMMTGMTRHWL